MKNQDWKLKYQDLKLKFHDAVDVAFRLGFEAGANNAQLQQTQSDAAAAAGQIPGQEQPGEMPEEQQSDGSELDQHIGTLENMLSQSKPGSVEQEGLQKSLEGLKAFQSNLKKSSDLKKSEKAIAAIGKAIKSPFTMNKAATKNMSAPAQKALNKQEQIVADMMKAFEEEEKKAKESVHKALNIEQILKG